MRNTKYAVRRTKGTAPDLANLPSMMSTSSIPKDVGATGRVDRTIPLVVPRPKITWRGVGVAAVLWLIYAFLYSLLIARDSPTPFVHIFQGQVFMNLVLALYSVPVWWLVVRGMDNRPWVWKIAAHLFLGPVYASLGLLSTIVVVGMTAPEAVIQEVRSVGQWIFYGNLTVYAVQFSIYHMVGSFQRLRWQEQRAMALMVLAQERELAALKAQVNPHFLFNTLNAITAMVGRDPEQAREMIACLAEMLRYALDSSKRDWVPLGEDLNFARAYLDLEAHRFPDRLEVHYEVDPDVLEAPVPPILLQPLVENAVKHGIAPGEGRGAITLRIAEANGRLHVSVEDTGHGPNGQAPPTPGGIGLSNTEARLRHLFGPEVTFHAGPQQPRGFKVSFSIHNEF